MSTSEDLYERLGRLELQNQHIAEQNRRLSAEVRRSKALGAAGVLAAVVVAALGAAQGTPASLEAGKLLLKASDGTLRAALVAEADGTTELKFYDKSGKVPIRLGIAHDRPAVTFLNEAGRSRLVVGLAKDGAPIIGLNDGSGDARMSLFVDEEARPAITLNATRKRRGLVLSVDKGGEPSLHFAENEKGEPAIAFYTDAAGTSLIRFDGRDGKTRQAVGISKGDEPFHIFYKDEKARLSMLLAERGEPRIDLRDKEGDAVVKIDDRDGRRGVTVYDDAGKPKLIEGVGRDGRPEVSLYDKDGATRSTWGLGQGDDPAFRLNGKDGQPRAILTSTGENGMPDFLGYDKTGTVLFDLRGHGAKPGGK